MNLRNIRAAVVALAVLVACAPPVAMAQSLVFRTAILTKRAVAVAGGGIPSLTLPVQVVAAKGVSSTQQAMTATVSVPTGQALAVYVFVGGGTQANATGCTSPVCTSGGDNLTCDAAVAGGGGTVWKCQGVLTHDLNGSDRGGTDTIKAGITVATAPLIYVVGVPSGGVTSSGCTAACSATTAFTSNNNPAMSAVTGITPNKWAIAFGEDNSAGNTATCTGGFTGLGTTPVLLAALYQITACYKQVTTSSFTFSMTLLTNPNSTLSYQVFN